MKLRCRLLSLLRLHNPECQQCNAGKTSGDELRQRLEEVNWRTLPYEKVKNGDMVVRTAISLKGGKGKKIA